MQTLLLFFLFLFATCGSVSIGFSSPPDGSPTEQGVDHRQVQRDLGEVSIYLQKPVVLSPSSAKISWTVSRTLAPETRPPRLSSLFFSLHCLLFSQRSPTSPATCKATEYSTAPSAAPGRSWTSRRRPNTAPRWWICTPTPSTRSRSVHILMSCRVETA